MRATYILLTSKRWHDGLFNDLQRAIPGNWIRVEDVRSFTEDNLERWKPQFIFIPHWSHIIPEKIFSTYECVVFHMTDLPFGRGGSPLQNLIVRDIKETKISALKVVAELDAGPIYLKRELGLDGSAKVIFKRATIIIGNMIEQIIKENLQPVAQQGVPVIFKRRTPSQSDLKAVVSINEAYDYIRMLDAEGYPHAFLETGNLRFEFTDADLSEDGELKAHVRIFKK